MSRARDALLAGLLLVSARVGVADTLMPSIIHEACAEYEKGQAFEVLARFEDESKLFDPKVLYRTRSDSHWKPAPLTKKAGTEIFSAVIKAKGLKGTLEYFIEVFDEYGNGPARMGSPETPIRVQPSKSPEPCVQIPQQTTMIITAGSAPGAGMDLTATTGGAPPSPPSTCERENPPLYCSGLLWAVIGVTALGIGG
ncbi:MAG: hypothetical protein V3T05_11755 [Myxococcota bacterium]